MSVSKTARKRGNILDEIMKYHRSQLPVIKRGFPLEDLRAISSTMIPPRDFKGALAQPGVSIIAECKKASPSKGLLVNNYDPVVLAKEYEKAGASAISVLTDSRHFQGSLGDLTAVKQAVKLPVIRKDFLFDPYHIYESRVAEADAILLIAAVLSDSELRSLKDLATRLGMAVLIEVHNKRELERALVVNPSIIGINNRNLNTFEVELKTTFDLREFAPDSILIVSESGIRSTTQIIALAEYSVDAALIGETLVKSKNKYTAVSSLVQAGLH